MKKEITYYKFYSEIRSFLVKLISRPLSPTVEPSDFLKNCGFTKEKLIHALIKRNILKRKESIKDPTNSEEKQAMYYIKYSVVKEGFENKIKKMFNEYFKQNISEMKQRKIYLTESQYLTFKEMLIQEEGEGISGGNTCTGVGGDNGMEYTAPAFGKSKNKNRKEKGTDTDFFKSSIVRQPGFSVERLDEDYNEIYNKIKNFVAKYGKNEAIRRFGKQAVIAAGITLSGIGMQSCNMMNGNDVQMTGNYAHGMSFSNTRKQDLCNFYYNYKNLIDNTNPNETGVIYNVYHNESTSCGSRILIEVMVNERDPFEDKVESQTYTNGYFQHRIIQMTLELSPQETLDNKYNPGIYNTYIGMIENGSIKVGEQINFNNFKNFSFK